MYNLLRAASAILVVAIAIALVTPSPRPLPPAPSTPSTTPAGLLVDELGTARNLYTLDWSTIYPGSHCLGVIVMAPGVVSVHSLGDVLRWVASMPSDTILFCSRYQAELAKPDTLRIFGPGQFEYFLRVSRRRIRVIVDEWQPNSSASVRSGKGTE